MSFTAKTAFEARITNNSNDTLCNVAGKFRVSTTDTDCSAGMLCVRNGKIPVEGISGTYNGTTVTVYNEGDVDTAYSVLKFAKDPADPKLCGFEKIFLKAGESKTVVFER